MNTILENFYLKSPVFLQNLMVAVKGLQLKRVRTGGSYLSLVSELKKRHTWSKEEFEAYQLPQLKRLLKHASLNVPFYRDKFKEVNFNPDKIKTVRDLSSLPLLEKSSLKANPDIFIDERINKKKIIVLHTTGSTGTPLKIYSSPIDRQLNYAFFNDYLNSLGVDLNSKRATFGGRIIVNPKQNTPPFWRYSYFQKNMIFSSYHLSNENLPYYYHKLRHFGPEYIDAYPSSIYSLSQFILKFKNSESLKPNVIVTSGATLFEEQRETIEEAFQTKVSDQYGCAEECIFVAQCSKGKYHYRPDYSVVEILNKDGKPSLPGERGEIVCTGLINQTMPLIRYRIGDEGILSSDNCSCGLNTPFFEKIIGRMDDFIITPDGRHIGRLSPVLKGFPVKEAQYVQKRIDQVVVNIVPDEAFNDLWEKELVKELQKRLGYSLDIEINYKNEIHRGPGGKQRTVISLINNANRVPDNILH